MKSAKQMGFYLDPKNRNLNEILGYLFLYHSGEEKSRKDKMK